MKSLFLFLSIFVFGGLIGCDTPYTPVNPVESGDSNISTNVSGEVIENDFELLKYMTDDENYMVSPFSLKMAMMLAANGAEGETKDEILNAFNIQDLDKFNADAKNIIERYDDEKDVTLNTANSIWLNRDRAGKNVEFNDEYKKIVQDFYYGVAEEESRNNIAKEINKWISEKTNNKIDKVLDEKKPAEFLAALVNTLYFKGDWALKFDKASTYKETFTSRDNKKSDIDFMHETAKYDYYEDENMKMVKLPYVGRKTAMYFVLPTNEDKMDISNALKNMQNVKVRLAIPTFKTEYNLSFIDMLRKMNINKAFNPELAEFKNKMFTGVEEERNVFIGEVIQKTFIEINENGTEAAAATVVQMFDNAALPPQDEVIKDFKADRPFIYFIIDEVSGEVLFIGEYAYAN